MSDKTGKAQFLSSALFGAVVAYYLPWLSNSSAALSANAYDLAEWVSIHPAVRGGDGTLPPLLAPFLLRAVLAALALLFGWGALRTRVPVLRAIGAASGVTLMITLLPPPEFFRGGWDDPNYRQQFGLALGTLILLAIGVAFRRRDAWLRVGQVTVVLLAIASAIGGEFLALNVIRSLGIPAPVGVGMLIMVGCLLLSGTLIWRTHASGSNPQN